MVKVSLIEKARMALSEGGIRRLVDRVYSRFRLEFLRSLMLRWRTPKDRFRFIFKSNYWASKESVSGTGSTLEVTANLRAALPDLFERYGVKTFLDAPCGDWNWMRLVIKDVPELTYIGGDIVDELIARASQCYSTENISFRVIDITHDAFPAADMMMVRDCLFHFSYEDFDRFIDNFLSSGIPYLLTTTHRHPPDVVNFDIVTGDYRKIDLSLAPFFLDAPPLEQIIEGGSEAGRAVVLFSREQIAQARARPRAAAALS